MKKSFRCFLACLLVLALSMPVFSGALAVESAQYNGKGIVEAKNTSIDVSGVRNGRTFKAAENAVGKKVSPTDKVTIMVQLAGDPAAVKFKDVKDAGSYREQLLADQAKAVATIEKAVNTKIDVKYNYSVIFNGFAFDGEYRLVDEIDALPGLHAFVAAQWEAPEPMLSSSTDMVGAIAAWDIGYTGAGTTVAVLDTGVKVDHEAFANDPEVVKYTRDDIAAIIASGNLVDSSSMNINDVYYSAKVPFRWNYQGHNYNVAHQYSDHGTHVAGIAAGNCDEIRGVAPDAQILAMQVFAPSGGASWDVIALALEDCAILGADSANLSLGSACGVEDAYDPAYDEILENCVLAGVNLAMAAGNDYDASYENAWGGYNLVQNPDTGVVGSPSTWKRSLSVAANNNVSKQGYYVQVGDGMFGYTENPDNPVLIADSVAGETYEVVAIPGYGDVADFEGLDVNGKVALIQRGEINFTDKAANAEAAGAVCAIVYNNTTGNINMVVNEGGTIPFIFIGQDAGLAIIDSIDNGDNMMYFSDDVAVVAIPGGGEPSEFSSWGTTPTLAIKPEITAPGGQIYSSTDPAFSNALYQAWDGTSMATPHVAGGMVIVTEYVEEMFPNLSTAEKQMMVDTILMSTADPINDAGGEYAAVRKQGAGEMNLEDAVTTKVYLSVEGQERPKFELGDDPDKTGVYNMTFKAHNFGDEDIRYAVRPTVLIEAISMLAEDYGGEPVIVYAGQSMKCTYEDCTIEAPATVVVPANGEAEITVKVTLTDDVKEYLDAYYTSGTYIEGFIELIPVSDGGSYVLGDANHDGSITSDDALLVLRHAMGTSIIEDTTDLDINGDGVVNASDALLILRVALGIVDPYTGYEEIDGADLCVPFLAFYGDWNYSAVIDRGYYYDDYSWQSHPVDNTVGYKKGNNIYGLGINPYIDTEDLSYYMADRNAVSPNDDGFLDTVNVLYVGFLRGTSLDEYVVYDTNGQELETILSFEDNTKGFYTGEYYDQMGVNYGFFPSWDASKYNKEDIVLSVEAYLNNDGRNGTQPFSLEANEHGTWAIPIHVDTIVPTATALSLNGGTASITVTDDHYVAYVGVYTYVNGAMEELVSETGVFEETRGASTTVELEAAEGNVIVLGDYAGNENVYRITNGALVEIGGNWSQGVGPQVNFFNPEIYGYGLNLQGNSYFYTDTNNMGGCYIAQQVDPGIEMKAGAYDGNGVLYAISSEGQMYIMTVGNPGEYISAPVLVGNTGNTGFTEMAYDQTTGKLYGVELAGTLYEIDPDTAATTVVGDIPMGAVAIDFYEGQCYTVDINGVFGMLDIETLTQTDINATGRTPVSSSGSFYPQSGCFINGNFFWVSCEAASQDSQLYQIDRASGEYMAMGYILQAPGVITTSLFGFYTGAAKDEAPVANGMLASMSK